MSDAFDTRPVRRVQRRDDAEYDGDQWPYTMAPVAQLLRDGLDLSPGVTVLVGENGSGKSTLVEAVALRFGFAAEGGSRGSQHATRASESELFTKLQMVRSPGGSGWGFFLRAETMHGFYTYLEKNPGGRDPEFHALSHGESFLALLTSRFDSPGFYCLDEPESALSFSGCLALVSTLHDIAAHGGQVLVATHSPIVASVPGATILEVGDWGWRASAWEDLELVQHWRRFLDSPERYLRHALD